MLRRREMRHDREDRLPAVRVYPRRVPGFPITLAAAAAAFSTFFEDHFLASGRAWHVSWFRGV